MKYSRHVSNIYNNTDNFINYRPATKPSIVWCIFKERTQNERINNGNLLNIKIVVCWKMIF